MTQYTRISKSKKNNPYTKKKMIKQLGGTGDDKDLIKCKCSKGCSAKFALVGDFDDADLEKCQNTCEEHDDDDRKRIFKNYDNQSYKCDSKSNETKVENQKIKNEVQDKIAVMQKDLMGKLEEKLKANFDKLIIKIQKEGQDKMNKGIGDKLHSEHDKIQKELKEQLQKELEEKMKIQLNERLDKEKEKLGKEFNDNMQKEFNDNMQKTFDSQVSSYDKCFNKIGGKKKSNKKISKRRRSTVSRKSKTSRKLTKVIKAKTSRKSRKSRKSSKLNKLSKSRKTKKTLNK